MNAVPLDRLIALVTAVRDGILADYATDQTGRLDLPEERGIRWAVPLLVHRPGAPPLEKPWGALHFRQTDPNESNIHSQGCGGASLELLPEMPKSEEDLGLLGDIKPLVRIAAGKYTSGNVGHFGRYAHVTPEMSGDVRMIHHLSLMPLCVDILSRFAKEMESLPADLTWSEDLSHLVAA